MASFRFVHAADVHLDSPLKGLVGEEDASATRIRSATREAFDALVDRTIDERAAFLVIAGDLYDGEWRDYQTGLYFVRQMGRLRQAGIPAFVVRGNHDAQSQITRQLTLPENVTVFSARRPETHKIPDLGVALHGQSFARRDVTENLALNYPPPAPGRLNIGVLHTALTGAEGHDNYAPCSLDQLVARGYDYWALGHVHRPAILRNGDPYVVYSGVLQGRHIRETGPKGAVLVSVDDGAISEVAPFAVDAVRWETVTVPAGGIASFEDLADAIRHRLEEAVSERSDGRLLACRLRITGTSAVHDAAVASEGRLLAEARAAAAGLGGERAWIERLEIATTPPLDTREDALVAEAFGAVDRALDDAAFLQRLGDEIGHFVSRLPHEVRGDPDEPLLRAAAARDYPRLVELAGRYARARLAGRGT